MKRRIFGLIGLMAACAAIFISASGAGADIAPASDPAVQSVQAPSSSYDYDDYDDDYDDDGGDYYATTTIPETTTTEAPTTTTEAPTTTTEAPTTTVDPSTTVAPQVLNVVADPAKPKVAASVDELASTGAGSAVLAGVGAAAVALGLMARRTARKHS